MIERTQTETVQAQPQPEKKQSRHEQRRIARTRIYADFYWSMKYLAETIQKTISMDKDFIMAVSGETGKWEEHSRFKVREEAPKTF